MKGKAHRPGLYNCKECREQFTVTVGTVFERSKIALNKWLLATFLMASSKKGMSAHQLHRMLGRHLQDRLVHGASHSRSDEGRREVRRPARRRRQDRRSRRNLFRQARRRRYVSPQRQGRPSPRAARPAALRSAPSSALSSAAAKSRMFHVEHATNDTVRDILVRNVARKSTLYTDESTPLHATGEEFATHDTVKHSADEYVSRRSSTPTRSRTCSRCSSAA